MILRIIVISILLLCILTFTAYSSGRRVVNRALCGPSAVSLWAYRGYPYKTQEEICKYDKEVQLRIEEYLKHHPEVKNPILFNLKELNVVVEGMNKEQVELLYGTPDAVIKKSDELTYDANEKWIYRSHSGEIRIFFKRNIVTVLENLHYEPIFP